MSNYSDWFPAVTGLIGLVAGGLIGHGSGYRQAMRELIVRYAIDWHRQGGGGEPVAVVVVREEEDDAEP